MEPWKARQRWEVGVFQAPLQAEGAGIQGWAFEELLWEGLLVLWTTITHSWPPTALAQPCPSRSARGRGMCAPLCEGRLSRNPFLPFHPSVPAWMPLYCQGLFTGRVWLLGHTFHVEFTSWTVHFVLFIEHLGNVASLLSSWFWSWSLCTRPPVTLRSARPILFLRVPRSLSAACYLAFSPLLYSHSSCRNCTGSSFSLLLFTPTPFTTSSGWELEQLFHFLVEGVFSFFF